MTVLDEAKTSVREWYKLELERRQARRQRTEGRAHVGTMVWLVDYGVLTDAEAADNEVRRAYGWRRKARGPYQEAVFSTIRLENIEVDARTGQPIWYIRQNLDPEFRDGDVKRDDGQRARTLTWRQLLESTRGVGTSEPEGFHSLIVENKKRGEQLLSGESSEVSSAVLDQELWFVQQWDDANHEAVLVRGRVPDEWRPPAAGEGLTGGDDEMDPDEGDPFRFPDPETRKKIERAAVDYVTNELGRRYDWRSVEHDIPKPGYDLIFNDKRTGEVVMKVEVKGTSRPDEHFFISRNEVRCAELDPQWRRIVVYNALIAPQFDQLYTWDRACERFGFEAMAFEGSPKDRSGSAPHQRTHRFCCDCSRPRDCT